MIGALVAKWLKPNGISVLLSAQNEEKIIRLCVESFLEFGDEIIIVTNGSTDGTRDICRKLVTEYPGKVQFYDKPDLPDLYQNRAYALTKAKYRWVFRGDSDYVAYNDEDGRYSIKNLRHRIMQTVALYPTAFYMEQVNLYYKINMTGISKKFREKQKNGKFKGHFVPETFAGYMPRIYLNTPFLKFIRQGRTEGVANQTLYKQIFIEQPYWLHITLKTDKDLFFRSERTNWRQLGNYESYPTLESYIRENVLTNKYSHLTLEGAILKYKAEEVMPYLKEYSQEENYPFTGSIKRSIDNGFFN
jgi:glycosyltransferase involved in cell wall biosynthesis